MLASALRQQSSIRLALGLTSLFFAFSFLPRVRESEILTWSFWGVTAGLVVWQCALLISSARRGRRLEIRVALRRPHYVQALLQISLFAYWGWYWPQVYEQAALIIAQLLFAYIVDMLLCWSRRNSWSLGFAQFPVVFSTNLFLWFRDDWFYLQFLMLGIGIFGKEFIKWTRDGRKTHIFNPSGLSLSIVSILLIAFGATDITWGKEIADTFLYPDNIYVVIFVLGLVVQLLFSVTPMTLAAAAVVCLLGFDYSTPTNGYYFIETTIPIGVFLGLHLLVTDPATSPRTDFGRFLFGALYGASVIAVFELLSSIGAPRFYDKLLGVPILNLSVLAIDRFTASTFIVGLGSRQFGPSLTPLHRNWLYILAWSTIFMLGYGVLDRGGSHLMQADHEHFRLVRRACMSGSGQACFKLAEQYQAGLGPERDETYALELFRRSCEKGWPKGCTTMARSYLRGIGVPVDHERAADGFRKACDGGEAISCLRLAEMYRRGDGIPRDPVRAADALRKACDADDATGCFRLADMYLHGDGIAGDPTRAAAIRAEACAMGMSRACETD